MKFNTETLVQEELQACWEQHGGQMEKPRRFWSVALSMSLLQTQHLWATLFWILGHDSRLSTAETLRWAQQAVFALTCRWIQYTGLKQPDWGTVDDWGDWTARWIYYEVQAIALCLCSLDALIFPQGTCTGLPEVFCSLGNINKTTQDPGGAFPVSKGFLFYFNGLEFFLTWKVIHFKGILECKLFFVILFPP